MAAATVIGSISQYIREELSYSKKETAPQVDGVFSRIYETSRGVKMGIGRNWQVLVTFTTGLAGGFKNVSAAGPSTLDQASTGQANMWDSTTLRSYPTVGQVATPATVQKTLTLVQGMGAFLLPWHYAQAEALGDNSIADPLDIIIRQTGKMVNQSEANHFYTNNATTKPIFIATTVSTDVTTNGAATCVFSFAAGTASVGRIGRLMPGMLVDAMDVSATPDAVLTQGTGGVVTTVDYIAKTFSVFFPEGAVTFADGDYLIQSGSTSASSATVGPSGAESWLTDTGTVFGISLTTHPQWKSLVATVNAVLDGAQLDKYVGGFYDAYGGMYDLDSVIITNGALTAYRESYDGLFRYERNNQRLRLKDGWSEMDFEWNGRRFQFLTSRYQKAGQAYIIKMEQGNIRWYVPPPVVDSQTKKEFPRNIQFTAPFYGSRNIFLPERAGTTAALTEFNTAPFICLRECCPEQIPGIFLKNLTEINP
jgi:hypothetical protein